MSDAYIMLALSKYPPIVEDVLVSIADTCRLSWEHPDTGHVLAVSDGFQLRDANKDQLLDTIRHERNVMFQLWWQAYWDVCCIFNSSPNYHTLNFSLAGVEEHNRDALYNAIIWITNKYAHYIATVVVDWEGSTAEIDYEEKLDVGLDYDDPFPDVLLVGYRFIKIEQYPHDKFAISPMNESIGRVLRIDYAENDL